MAIKAGSLADLDAILSAVADAIGRDVKQLVTDVVVNVAAEVAKRTPVDTGYARANWYTTLGSPAASTIMQYKRYPSRWRKFRGRFSKGGSFTERVNTRGVTEQARAAMVRRNDDQTVYITNNVPYTAALNQGHSPQAPAGFVRVGVAVGTSKAVKAFRFMHLRKMKPRKTRKK